MKINRRGFLKAAGVCTAAVTGAGTVAAASEPSGPSSGGMGMLVDTTVCIGCRKCEYACAQQNQLSDAPLASFEETSVFERRRHPEADAYTVVNRFADTDPPGFVKIQCMHCLKPACVSACLVGALQRHSNGSVTYDAWKCMGCRYCMVACPFEIPAYEYEDPLAPEVRKCNFCFSRQSEEGKIPACAEMCPPMALTFGKRDELLAIAHEKIAAEPDKYIDHVYGEKELGGTSWLYLASRPFEELGLRKRGDTPPPALTETLQHSIFKFGALPVMLFGVLGAAKRLFGGEPAGEGDQE